MPWKAIACSAKGTSHEKTGKPCQDYAGFIRVNDSGEADDNGDIAIGAVCDGAGSYKYSDLGSKLAVETVLKLLQDWLKWLKQQREDLSRPISQAEAHQVFAKIISKVKEEFAAKAKEMSCEPKDLSCTLLVVVATPQWLVAMQIGDGFIVIRQPDLNDELSEYKLLFQPTKGEYANQTTFITASNAREVMQCAVVPEPQQFIFASTDGLERLALEIGKESKPYPPFFDTFRDAIQIRSEAEEKNSTEKWLQWEEVNNRTDDDKTILLCWYEALKSKSSDPEPPIQGSPAVPPAKKEDFTLEVGALVINVLAGIFWNSLWHDLFFDISFKSPVFNYFIGLVLALLLTVLILLVDWQLYKQQIKQYSQNQWKTKGHLFLYMAIICLVGLGLGGFCYYMIREALLYLSNVSIGLPK
jgi:Protein phosphatase 2C